MATLAVTREAARENAVVTIASIPSTAVTYTLERTSPSGNTVAVRGAWEADLAGDPTIVRDWEVPFGVSLTYRVTFYSSTGAVVGVGATATYTHPYTDCPAWVVDLAQPTNSLALTIESFVSLDFAVPAGVIRVLDRRAPVLVTLPAWTPDAELVLLTTTLPERDTVRTILGTGYPFLLRTIPDQGVGNMYLGVTDFKEERIFSLGDRAMRRFVVEVVQVERPDPSVFIPRPPTTYAQVADDFADYADLLTQVQIYSNLPYWDYSAGAVSGTAPWLPADV